MARSWTRGSADTYKMTAKDFLPASTPATTRTVGDDRGAVETVTVTEATAKESPVPVDDGSQVEDIINAVRRLCMRFDSFPVSALDEPAPQQRLFGSQGLKAVQKIQHFNR